MNSPQALSRRDMLKTLGAGAALVSLAQLPAAKLFAESAPRSVGAGLSATPQPLTLPKLAYAYDALEPHIDARTMEIHHTKHHQAYINNANKALESHDALKAKTAEALLANLSSVPESIRTTVRNNVGGHVNHSLFWRVIGPNGGGTPRGELGDAITQAFGSFDAFKTKFAEAGAKQFGSGWAWLSLKGGVLTVHSTANQDSPLIDGATPLVGLDVWEHAYYLKYQNRRADYISAFWEIVNWDEVSANYRAALGTARA
ncbi:MAG: superoxide dismutase [Opitutus sp.]|nr:superoxide dismutase [Opitutus sp.]